MSKTSSAETPRRRPYVDEPPVVRLHTVEQMESKHPALLGRLRTWIHKADAGHPTFIGLRRATVRVGRSLFINEAAFEEWLGQRAGMPAAPSRRGSAGEEDTLRRGPRSKPMLFRHDTS